jgi:cytochrome bd-type quinol oxidase subunit 1
MDLPVIDTPVFPRWVWIEEITYSHIPIATLITAFMILAPIYEYIGHRRGDPRFDRLAKGMIWFVMILFSPGAALGTGIPVYLIGTYPEFWSRWSNIFFWPLFAQFIFFLLEVAFLFFGYYLTWERWRNRKVLHVTMGGIAALWGLLVQVVWDALGSYMLTPGRGALPAVTEPVAWSAAGFFNPSFPLLLSHRFFGNISYTMLLVGGAFAIKYMRRTRPDQLADREYYRWGADLTFTIGMLAFFAQPLIGWFYAENIHANAPAAFAAIMGGHNGLHFTIKMSLLAAFLTIGAVYVGARSGGRLLPVAITAGLLGLLAIVALHPPLGWYGGSATAWYVVSAGAIVAVVAAVWLARLRATGDHKGWRWAMLVAGLAAFFTFCLGGFVREACRNPDTVYGQLAKPEVTPKEADRWLTYRQCLPCHSDSPAFLERTTDRDWPGVVARERARPGAPRMTDEQAAMIVRYLQEDYP